MLGDCNVPVAAGCSQPDEVQLAMKAVHVSPVENQVLARFVGTVLL